ncbi:hypothetical protein SAMN05421837_101449 [Amycolatopsis pretoriensis]|uniref:Uncharacterized protein n=1 Tax=Amycolatopsis pretoriensis TaxID=218821 RepID=A0A1H5Q3X9_9PSEU|nr:hypothetical protein [Amycolatopsis pretoriensis]SEF20629.1 hypothetical protein SAMN05421837_101449 [Amycolatopsis pretoriensis]
MTEQLGFATRPAADRALKLSSAVVTTDGGDHLVPWELSVSAQVLGETEIMLATTHRPGGSTADGHHELHVNAILLSMIPDVIHLAGRGAPRTGSCTLTLTFSEGDASRSAWTTTFEVPGSPLGDSTWHLTVPFGPSAGRRPQEK